MKKLLLLLIRGYQKWISPLKRPCCRFYPTCSQYAAQAVTRHGAAKGAVLSLWRILRCNPWNRGGIDRVPERWTDAFGRPVRKKNSPDKKSE